MISQSCPFCSEDLTDSHHCIQKTFDLFKLGYQEKNAQEEYKFDNIDNLVFQGGGIKGIAYIGVLQQLLKENPNILSKAKRFAGTSAGSILALYLGLGLDLDSEIRPLLSRSYSEFLDSGIALKVTIPGTLWRKKQKLKFWVKDVLLKAIEGMHLIQNEDDLTTLLTNFVDYYKSKLGLGFKILTKFFGQNYIRAAARKIITLFRSETQIIPDDMETNSFQNSNQHFENTLDRALDKAFVNILEEEAKEANKENIVISHEATKEVNFDKENESSKMTIEKEEKNTIQLKDSQEQSPADEQRNFRKILEKDVSYYKTQEAVKPIVDDSDKSKLSGKILHFAVAELLWFVLISQLQSTEMKKEAGLFSGEIIKADLIEEPIKKKFLKLRLPYRSDLTFKEFFELTDPQGKSYFKPFYVVVFNSSLLRSEVFSLEHTPHAIVSDAVRASMSMPVFFKPVPIRHKVADKIVPRSVYTGNGDENKRILFMDGGILDNYPLWVFDDMKYCLDDISGWKSKRKIFVSNPKTLGFRILNPKIIYNYTQPYFDGEVTHMKQLTKNDDLDSFGALALSLFATYFGQTEENHFFQRGDAARSVYVDNLGISAIAFNLSQEEGEELMRSGERAVKNYKKRIEKNFYGEII